MNRYIYNASDDALVAWNRNFTSRIGDGTGDPEEDYLSTLQLVAASKPDAALLEIGCGLGRIIRVMNHVGPIVGLEPDAERFRASFASLHDGERVQILNCTSTSYRTVHPQRRFGIVVVSMVIQHVPTTTCDRILRDVHDFLAADGLAVVATTQQDEERFTYQADQTHRRMDEFDAYAGESASQTRGIPVRQFSKASFLAAVRQSGLSVVRWGQFSYVRPEKVAWFAKWMGSRPVAIQDVATSQYAILRRAA
ncbi:MAG: class I SAM-dependent methyltransferase [Planctomycetia bacterium]|nr:class I SAM-dependent methyltransferase [Planctomycetia bacterium]